MRERLLHLLAKDSRLSVKDMAVRRDSENIGGDGSGWRDLRISYADQLG